MPTIPADQPSALRTPRLDLRALGEADAPALFAIYGDEQVMRHASDPPFPTLSTVIGMLASVARLQAEGESIEWAIVRREDAALVGTCGLHGFDLAAGTAEVGILLARAAWGRGLAREALSVLIVHAWRAFGLRRLRADIDADNARSRALFAGLGFRPLQGTLHERVLDDEGGFTQRGGAASSPPA